MEICTREMPFSYPRGDLYYQVDGVAMGSRLRVLLANFLMESIESTTIKNHRLSTYARYGDDIFICIKNLDELKTFKQQLRHASGLSFSHEESKEGRPPFLHVLISVQKSGLDVKNTLK